MAHHGPGLSHGAHPQHQESFFPISALSDDAACDICHASAFRTEAVWYRCCMPHCGCVLCHKCFEVDEVLLPSTLTVMRNPTLAYSDEPNRPISVHTRPRRSGFQLAPIYPGKLLEVVSRANSTEDGTSYFRLQNGGWICSSNVVIATPKSESNNIGKLTEVHTTGACEAVRRALMRPDHIELPVPAQMEESDLLACMRESMQLMDDSLPYGMVMSFLVMYPLLTTTGNALASELFARGAMNEEDSNMGVSRPSGAGGLDTSQLSRGPSCTYSRVFSEAVLQFTHMVLHAALDDIERRMEDEEPLEEGTAFSLYGDVIGGCLLALQDVSELGGIVLPDAFLTLVMRALHYYASVVPTILRRTKPAESEGCPLQSLRGDAVQRDNTDMARELNRVYHLARAMISVCSQLIQRALHRYPVWLKQLVPLRHRLIYVRDEGLESAFCDLVTHSLMSPASGPTSQKHVFQVDPLEIAVRLLTKATLATSQLSALRLLCAATHNNPRNIEITASVVLPHVLNTLKEPHSSSVVVAVLDCLSELAFNDPRREVPAPFETPKRFAARGEEGDELSPAPCTCSQALHPNTSPFQTMHVYRLGEGVSVGLCGDCAAHHPPANADELSEPTFAHFQCQCQCCSRRASPKVLPPPNVPTTSAIKSMQDCDLWKEVSLRTRLDADNVAVLNGIGRLTLRLAAPVSVIHALAAALLHKTSLSACADAALAVASNRHLQHVQELLASYPNSALTRFIATPYTSVADSHNQDSRAASLRKTFGGSSFITPSQSHMKSELGLSPSPSLPASAGYSSIRMMDRQGSGSVQMSHPSVDLFPTASVMSFGPV